jgi:23S rRNA (adenine2030-N6)-methyltransferase
VPPPRSRYRPGAPPDYGHRFHAGNVGDVWKHCALVEILRRAAAAGGRVAYVDTHAGEGRYALGPTGEWTEGIGRLWDAGRATAWNDTVAHYVALCRRLGAGGERPHRYPGSPALARAVLGAEAELLLFERDPAAFAHLAADCRGDRRVHLECGDGLAALGDALRTAERHARAVVALIDPPYAQKADWTVVPAALIDAVGRSTRACVVLWYPVKSLTRPNAMVARLEAARVPGAIAELVTTPLDLRRHRLNGSGLLLVRPPAGTLKALGAAAPILGALCATHGTWSLRMRSWTPDISGTHASGSLGTRGARRDSLTDREPVPDPSRPRGRARPGDGAPRPESAGSGARRA